MEDVRCGVTDIRLDFVVFWGIDETDLTPAPPLASPRGEGSYGGEVLHLIMV